MSKKERPVLMKTDAANIPNVSVAAVQSEVNVKV